MLVHDTYHSTSLLTQLVMKTGGFLSTSCHASSEPVVLGLVRRINVGVHDGVGGEAKYWPLCDERYFRAPQQSRLLPFHDWWTEVVFRNDNQYLTRGDLVLAIANKDGGAHVDSQVDLHYDEFRQTWSGGTTLVGIDSGAQRGYDNIPTFPAIRQITHEILHTVAIEMVTQ